jgi:hypothetical protein
MQYRPGVDSAGPGWAWSTPIRDSSVASQEFSFATDRFRPILSLADPVV